MKDSMWLKNELSLCGTPNQQLASERKSKACLHQLPFPKGRSLQLRAPFLKDESKAGGGWLRGEDLWVMLGARALSVQFRKRHQCFSNFLKNVLYIYMYLLIHTEIYLTETNIYKTILTLTICDAGRCYLFYFILFHSTMYTLKYLLQNICTFYISLCCILLKTKYFMCK